MVVKVTSTSATLATTVRYFPLDPGWRTVRRVNRIAFLAASLSLTALACGPSTPAQAPEAPKETASAEPAASAAPSASAAPEEPKAAPPAESTSPAETLARDLVKSSGRRIGWSASKKRFVVPIEMRSDGGRGLDVRFYDDDGNQRENQRVCQPGECEERLNEIAKELIPKLAARFESEGYEAIGSVGWPSGREEIDVGSLELKLRYAKGKLSAVREKKPPVALRVGGGKGPKADALSAIYPVPAAKLVGAFAPGDKNAQEFFVFKLP